jgi:hypothetical protein
VHAACWLVACHPRSLELLESGELPVWQSRVLVEATAHCEPATARAVDAEVAERACRLPSWRVKQEAHKVVLRLDADAAAARAAASTRDRAVRKSALEDGQAEVVLTGPALPLTAWYDGLSAEARAAKAAGDARTLDALRFDLAVGAPPPAAPPTAPPTAPHGTAAPVGSTESGTDGHTHAYTRTGRQAYAHMPMDTVAAADASQRTDEDDGLAAAGQGAPTGPEAPAWLGDRRRARPVQALLHVPVSTALGLSNEPGWLEGYGWVSAPQCRQLLPDAELRQVCVTGGGQVIDSADRVIRPESTPEAVREALLGMVLEPFELTAKTSRSEPQHDPSMALAGFAQLRDRYCDGPTGTQLAARAADLDHDTSYPHGPTAAWNLSARSRRTHALKHRGWTRLRGRDSTLWFSPAGQLVEVPRFLDPPPQLDPAAELPDPGQLHALDAELIREPDREDDPPMPPPF